jgi:UDP-N-acetylglucosamine--N-acetylmuramyl-(pentapeptide) pyrophosphoryl-undecaprenol N-acetylglucosamine transferase
MKILLTGGGSGGHFYPIIAVAQALRKIAKEEKLIDVELFYMAPMPYDKQLLYDNQITFVKNNAGKLRRYFSISNIADFFKTGWGIVTALWTMLSLYPDVVFGKGGGISFPALLAARIYRIPVESDSYPGRMNAWAAKFARRIAISFPQTAEYFPKYKDKVALTGCPIRADIVHPMKEGAHAFLNLDRSLPTILIIGGSQGSQLINEHVVDAAPVLVEKYNVIHQTGKNNINAVKNMADILLEKSEHKDRYKIFDSLDATALRMAAGAADIIISRAGSTIFEIAAWGIPAILIPISDSNGDHQRKNAYSYARSGGAIVIEENNVTAHILTSEVDRIINDKMEYEKMKEGAHAFAKTDAANLIAREILAIALQHEK